MIVKDIWLDIKAVQERAPAARSKRREQNERHSYSGYDAAACGIQDLF